MLDVKTCPECAEEIREAARVCRYCGYRFEAETVAFKRSDWGRLTSSSAALALVALALVVGGLLLSGRSGGESKDQPTGRVAARPSERAQSPQPSPQRVETVKPEPATTSEEWQPESAPRARGDEPVRCNIEEGCVQGDAPVPQVVQGDPCTTAAGEEGAWYGPGGDVLRCTAAPGELEPSEPVLCEYRDCSQGGRRIPAVEFYEGMECHPGAKWTLVEVEGETETFECRESE